MVGRYSPPACTRRGPGRPGLHVEPAGRARLELGSPAHQSLAQGTAVRHVRLTSGAVYVHGVTNRRPAGRLGHCNSLNNHLSTQSRHTQRAHSPGEGEGGAVRTLDHLAHGMRLQLGHVPRATVSSVVFAATFDIDHCHHRLAESIIRHHCRSTHRSGT